VFRDAGDAAGVLPAAAKIKGHGAGWGDADGDGWIDLFVGTFHAPGQRPSLLLRNRQGRFEPDAAETLRISARVTGVVFLDLDNDGDLDLYVGSMPQPKNGLVGCQLFRNDGKGAFTNITKDNGACPPAFGGRSAAGLDYDGDGLLDLMVGEDPLPGYNGSPTKSSRLFRNLGGLQFEDVSRAAGIPEGIPGYGVAAADVNDDGWPDLFLAASGGGNVLLLNDGRGKFRRAPETPGLFAWEQMGGDNMICGVSFGDVNRDGRLDMVIGPHFKAPWKNPMPVRLYMNRGSDQSGNPRFENVTAATGLTPIPMKAPHVEIQDFDNDGWPDIVTSTVKFRDGNPYPVIFKHLGVKAGEPHFREDALAVNDFPTEADANAKSDFFVAQGKIIYMAPGPSGDYDNDGKLDLFLPSWWPNSRSLLLHNETPGGNWLQVQVKGSRGVNAMGIGARIKVYPAGKLRDAAALLWCSEMSVGHGYASGQPAIAHIGLGAQTAVDIDVILPHGRGAVTKRNVKANQRLTIE
jgi:hypothetical protein